METYYSLLGVSETAKPNQIREAYIKMAKDCHPDSAKTPEETERLNERFILVNKAYKILRDETKRKEYDAYLRKKRLEAKITANKMKATTEKAEEQGKHSPEPPRKRAESKPRIVEERDRRRPPQRSQPKESASRTNLETPQKTSKEAVESQFGQVQELMKSGNLQKAREKLRLIIKLDPKNAKYCSYLAYINVQLNTGLNEAHQFARKAIQLDPENPLHHYHLGLVFEVAGHEQKAKQKFNQALELDPRFLEARKALQKYEHKASFWRKNLSGIFGKKK